MYIQPWQGGIGVPLGYIFSPGRGRWAKESYIPLYASAGPVFRTEATMVIPLVLLFGKENHRYNITAFGFFLISWFGGIQRGLNIKRTTIVFFSDPMKSLPSYD